jgi:hypothetical protein
MSPGVQFYPSPNTVAPLVRLGLAHVPSSMAGRAISCRKAETGSHAIRRTTASAPTEGVDLFSIRRKH